MSTIRQCGLCVSWKKWLNLSQIEVIGGNWQTSIQAALWSAGQVPFNDTFMSNLIWGRTWFNKKGWVFWVQSDWRMLNSKRSAYIVSRETIDLLKQLECHNSNSWNLKSKMRDTPIIWYSVEYLWITIATGIKYIQVIHNSHLEWG